MTHVAWRLKHRNDGPHMWEYYPLPVHPQANSDIVTQSLTLSQLLDILNDDRHANAQERPPEPHPPLGLEANEAWTELCETADIISPAEYPDHALITIEQLRNFMCRAAPAFIVPAGWLLVPKEPTREMCEAPQALPAIHAVEDRPLAKEGWMPGAVMNLKRYRAMIAAAPSPCTNTDQKWADS